MKLFGSSFLVVPQAFPTDVLALIQTFCIWEFSIFSNPFDVSFSYVTPCISCSITVTIDLVFYSRITS